MLLRSLNKNSTSILLLKQTSYLSIFLDVTLNLSTENINLITSWTMISYLLMLPPTTHQILPKNLPDSTSKRIKKLVSDEHVFSSTKDLYNNALDNSSYKEKSNSSIMYFLKHKNEKAIEGVKLYVSTHHTVSA